MSEITSGKSVVSPVLGEGLANTKFIVAVPIVRPLDDQFGVAVLVGASQFREIFTAEDLPEKWQAAIVDQKGNYVARSHDAEKRVGTPARPQLVDIATGSAVSGRFVNTTYENVDVNNDFKRSKLTGWTTFVAVPMEVLSKPSSDGVMIVAIGGLIAVLTSLAFASIFTVSIARPVRQLSVLAAQTPARQKMDESLIEVNEVREALIKAAGQRALLSAIVQSSGDAIISVSSDEIILSWNKAATELFGYSAEEIVGHSKTLLIPPEHSNEYKQMRDRVLRGESVWAETVRRTKDGTPIDVSLNLAPVYNADGGIIATSSILRDIRERKSQERHLLFLMKELAHRSKNQFAIIQAIVTQTARSTNSVDEFASSLRRRLHALAASIDILTSQNWQGADLSDLVRHHLEPFTDEAKAIELSGPRIFLQPAAAERLGLAFHELATNSAKYGALSVERGRVEIHWSVTADGEGRFSITWTELGGPSVKPPLKRGFGSTVIEKIVSQGTGGVSELNFGANGVRWQLSCPLNRIQADSKSLPDVSGYEDGHIYELLN
ncbi:MAG: PAS domain S-box protein [Rhodomicrobium sp.]|nr:PAS domain S-box protein [Rhodomicrobium sp.]